MTKPFDADHITPHNWEGAFGARKKPVLVWAVQLNFPEGFIVSTINGTARGAPGDYLVINSMGDRHVVGRVVFERAYERVEEKP